MSEIVDDSVDFGWLQGAALDLRANGIEAFRSSCGSNRDLAACRFSKSPERRFGKTYFVRADHGIFVRDQQRRQQDFGTVRNSTRLKPRKISGRKARE